MKIRNLYLSGKSQQFLFAIQQAELATVTGSKLPDGKFGFCLRTISDLPFEQ